MKITEKQINERVEEFRKQLINDFTEPKFELNKWYNVKYPDGNALINYQSDKGNSYGFSYSGKWSNDFCVFGYDNPITFELEAESKVRDILIKELKEKYPINSKVKSAHSGSEYTISNYDITFNFESNRIHSDGICVFDNGKWAEIVKEKTIDDWANNYYEFRESFKGSTAEAFKQFITKHNFQLPK